MQRRYRREPLHEFAPHDRGDHRGGVEPEPLLIDEPSALAQPLPILDQHGAADRARYRHAIGRELQRPHQLVGRGKLRGPDEAASRGDIGRQQIRLPAVAEDRHEIGKGAVERLNDPGKVENGEIGGDLQRRPTMHFFQIKTKRLGEEANDLAGAFHDIDEGEKQHQAAYQRLVPRWSVGLRRWKFFVHRIAPANLSRNRLNARRLPLVQANLIDRRTGASQVASNS